MLIAGTQPAGVLGMAAAGICLVATGCSIGFGISLSRSARPQRLIPPHLREGAPRRARSRRPPNRQLLELRLAPATPQLPTPLPTSVVVTQRPAQVLAYAGIMLLAVVLGAAAFGARAEQGSVALVVGAVGLVVVGLIARHFSRFRIEADARMVTIVGDRSRVEIPWSEILAFEFEESPPRAIMRTTDGWPMRLTVLEGHYFQRSPGQVEWARQGIEALENYRQGVAGQRRKQRKRRRKNRRNPR